MNKILLVLVTLGLAQDSCDPAYPTLSVASDKILLAREWKKFTKKTPFFILGVSDSTCKECCESEPMLRTLQEMSVNGTISWVEEGRKKKKKKEKVHQIPVVRIDVANKKELNSYRELFDMKLKRSIPRIYLVKNGELKSTHDAVAKDPSSNLDLIIQHMLRLS
jgi:hypothetical protein